MLTAIVLRVVNAIADSNRRKAEREVARYIARTGGKLTDDLERRIAFIRGGAR